MNSPRKAHLFLQFGIAPLLFLSLSFAAAAAPPVEAIRHGFTQHTFTSNFTTKTVDMNDTHNTGYKWYLADIFGRKADPRGVKLNSDGSVTLVGDDTGTVGSLTSVVRYRGTDTFVGTAIGGGAYVEAVMHYDPSTVKATHAGGKRYPYPAFWSLPMEGDVIPGANQWKGEPPGYIHNVEVDFFEADYVNKLSSYGVGLHDWYGIPHKTCPPGLCVVHIANPSGEREPPAGTDFRKFHTYGFLWVPATSGSNGSMSAFFDGKLIGHTHMWTQFTGQAPTPRGKPWTFGHIDQEHLLMILGTGEGEPFTIKSVNVWQRNAAGNISNDLN